LRCITRLDPRIARLIAIPFARSRWTAISRRSGDHFDKNSFRPLRSVISQEFVLIAPRELHLQDPLDQPIDRRPMLPAPSQVRQS